MSGHLKGGRVSENDSPLELFLSFTLFSNWFLEIYYG